MNPFSFSSEVGKDLVRHFLWDLWPHTPRDHQLEAVTKALDGINVLAILPTGAGKTAILIIFMLVVIHMKVHLDKYAQHSARFLDDPIMIVVYPTNCLEEEQVRMPCIRHFSKCIDRRLRPPCSGRQG